MAIQVSELLKGRSEDYYRIDFISLDYKEIYTLTVCPGCDNYDHWEGIVRYGNSLCPVIDNFRTLYGDYEKSRCPNTGAIRINADGKPDYLEAFDRDPALALLKESLGLNPMNPIADPLDTLFGYSDEQ